MERLRRITKEVLTVGVLALVLFSARSSLADHYVVPTSSMEYTLMPGDRVLVNKLAYGLRVPFIGWRLIGASQPIAGEVVVFDSPETGKRLIKRVVAVGGDTVQIRRGELMVNGEAYTLAEDPGIEDFGDHRAELNLSSGSGNSYGPREIPEGHVLVMGDYRGNSHDGRMFGSVPASDLYGRAVAVFLRRGDGFTWRPL
ncbi:MAG: signal peptidase I [Acidobacteria bacterium]|nr:signal peptidase I [Acidobacteriota bacterium]